MHLLNHSISIIKILVFYLFGSISYASGNPVVKFITLLRFSSPNKKALTGIG